MHDFIWLLLLMLGLLYWQDGIQAKEIARQAGRRVCKQNDVQFLDDTVQQQKIGLQRDDKGRIRLSRRYIFEFASDGEKRYHGHITLLGKIVKEVDMEVYRA